LPARSSDDQAAEAWHPARKPEKIRSREDFLARIATHLAHAPIEAQDATCAVFQFLGQHVTPGEVQDAIEELPQDIGTLWPQARGSRARRFSRLTHRHPSSANVRKSLKHAGPQGELIEH
jgi:hypothetical protein